MRYDKFAVIDWSGAKGATQKGLAVAASQIGDAAPDLVAPPDRRWSRGEVLEWLLAQAGSRTNIIVGLDLSPGLPFVDQGSYFPGWSTSPGSARDLWRLVDDLSDIDPHFAVSSFVNHPEVRRHFRQHKDCGDLFEGGAGRFRVCERQQRKANLSPYSCLNLVGAAQVGKSSLTGMRVLNRLAGKIPVWPFDPLPETGPVIVEIYTSIAARAAGIPKGHSKILDGNKLDHALAALGSRPHTPLHRYTDHATDAILTAAWLRANVHRPELWHPPGLKPEIARTEGWTFGVV
jgi:hypothetical protein